MSMSEKFEQLEKTTKAAVNEHNVDADEAISDDVSKLSTAEIELRKKAIEGMDEGLRQIYEKEKEAYKDHRGDIVTFNYDRGSVAAEINRNPKYGEAAVNLMATALGVDRSTMYKTIKFSNMYVNKKELETVLDGAENKGMTLTWSHFVNVLHIPESSSSTDPHEDRRKMINLAVENKLSVRALAAEVKLVYGNKKAKKVNNVRANVKSLFKQIITGSCRYGLKLKTKVDELLSDVNEAIETGSDEDLKLFAQQAASVNEGLENLAELIDRVTEYTGKIPGTIIKNSSERKKTSEKRDDSSSRSGKSKIAR
jgi:hypothetical protein